MFRSDILAFDFVPVRAYDRDGRLRVRIANISKANVCDYLGSEIPADGLDPHRVYRLWRHPDELARAATTFDSVPLLARHVPVSVEDHKPSDVVGATGSDARFEAPFLTNSLIVWAASAIKGIEDRSCRELSCAYRYEAEMRPGRTPDGQTYDGIMRDLHGNHLALVSAGRAGSDVVVGDGAIRHPGQVRFHERYPDARRIRNL